MDGIGSFGELESESKVEVGIASNATRLHSPDFEKPESKSIFLRRLCQGQSQRSLE